MKGEEMKESNSEVNKTRRQIFERVLGYSVKAKWLMSFGEKAVLPGTKT